MRYAVKVFYLGDYYYGYQRQPDVPTVEGTIINALKKAGYITDVKTSNFASATRTDRYVSALGNCFAFNTKKDLIITQLNHFLPHNNSIICWAKSTVDEDFSPRFAKLKKYWYFLSRDYLNEKQLSINDIKKVSKKFEGTHDFRLFSKFNEKDTIRSIDKINLIENQDSLILEFIGQSFLWQQIRRIVSYIVSFPFLPEQFQDTEELLGENSINHLPLKPASPHHLLFVEHYYENLNWKVNQTTLKKILSYSMFQTFELDSKHSRFKKQWSFFKDIIEEN